MKKLIFLSVILVGALAVILGSGAGDAIDDALDTDGHAGSCGSVSSAVGDTCIDYEDGLSTLAAEAACDNDNGDFSRETCATNNSSRTLVGQCEVTYSDDRLLIYNYYDSDYTADLAEAHCTGIDAGSDDLTTDWYPE